MVGLQHEPSDHVNGGVDFEEFRVIIAQISMISANKTLRVKKSISTDSSAPESIRKKRF